MRGRPDVSIHRRADVRDIIRRALQEDIRTGDITTEATIPPRQRVAAAIVLKEEDAVLCGGPLIPLILRNLDANARMIYMAPEGSCARAPRVVARVEGRAHAILQAERTLLNLIARLSGIATLTRRFVRAARPSRARIYDTRKTTPGLRVLEKYAVRVGGGHNHRFGLFDHVLIKDNHRDIVRRLTGRDNFAILVQSARRRAKPRTLVEIEVDSLPCLKQALAACPDIVMLDNMRPAQMRAAVRLRNRINHRVKLEASGNVDEHNVRAVARTGVDIISVGRLTHAARSVDMSLTITGIA